MQNLSKLYSFDERTKCDERVHEIHETTENYGVIVISLPVEINKRARTLDANGKTVTENGEMSNIKMVR